MKKVAINIETDKWSEIISELQEKGWIMTAKYYGFDAGIDDDFLVLRKGFKKIIFGWSNFSEGEIKCSDDLFDYLKEEFDLELEYGKPVNLKTPVILLYYMQSLPLFILKRLNIVE